MIYQNLGYVFLVLCFAGTAALIALSVRTSDIDQAQILQVGNVTSEVVRKSIAISDDGILSFAVKTSLPKGEAINVKLETALLKMDASNTNFDDFRFETWKDKSGTVGRGNLATFAVPVGRIRGPAYLRIIPQYFSGKNPPVVTSFWPSGPYKPCNPCNSHLSYMEPWAY